MSDVDVSFNLSYSPNPVGVTLALGISGSTVAVTLGGVPPLLVNAIPNFSGNVVSGLVSVLATPLANAVTMSLGPFVGNILNGRTFNVITVNPYSFNAGGVSGVLTPSNLSLSNFNGLLKIGGSFTL
jgi:hypothetical protein